MSMEKKMKLFSVGALILMSCLLIHANLVGENLFHLAINIGALIIFSIDFILIWREKDDDLFR